MLKFTENIKYEENFVFEKKKKIISLIVKAKKPTNIFVI